MLPALIAAAPYIISGVSALGGLLGNRGSKAQQEQIQNRDLVSAPQYDDQTLYLRNQLMNMFMDRARFNDDVFGGYTQEGLGNINRGSDIASRSIENILAARGLGGTTAGSSSQIQNELARINQQNSFLNSIPLLRDQRQQQNLGDLSKFFGQIPIGTRQTGQTRTTGTTEQPGNPLGGLFGNLGITLAGLYGKGAFGGKGPAIND